MSMIFQFRMLCDEDDYFLREYEVPYDMTLAAFRDFINKDLQYRPEELTSFFTADDRWNKLQEFTADGMKVTKVAFATYSNDLNVEARYEND